MNEKLTISIVYGDIKVSRILEGNNALAAVRGNGSNQVNKLAKDLIYEVRKQV